METGVYPNLSNDEYHSGPGVSNSGLSLLRRSPLHLRARMLAANDNRSTPAMEFGTAFHALILEPGEFAKGYCLGLRQSDFPDAIDSRDKLLAMVAKLNETRLPKLSATGTKDELVARILEALPEGARTEGVTAELKAANGKELKAHIDRLNEGRTGLLSVQGTIPQLAAALRAEGVRFQLWDEIKAEWLANNGHRNVLDPETWDQLHRMREAVYAHPAARAALSLPGKAEQSVYWTDKETGVLCRCRPDWWAQEAGVILDVKTTEDASLNGFRRSIEKYAYDVQDAFYNDGIKAATGKPLKQFLFLAVEKDACVIDGIAKGVEVYRLTDASRDLARAIYRNDLATYARCANDDHWPGYSNGMVQPIEVSSWHFAQNAHLFERVA